MGIIKKIKELIMKKKPRLETTEIVPYDTTLIYIPQYSELTEDDKKVVDRYIAETDIKKVEDIILYGNTVYKKANVNTELLVNLFYKITDDNSDWKLNKMTQKEILQKRLNEMILTEELELYKLELINLEREAVLRIVALEKVQKQIKKDISKWITFEKAEILRRKNRDEQLKCAIERMKINKKTIEQQMQLIKNTIIDTRNNITSC